MYIAVVSIKLSIGYSGIRERSHLGCPFGMLDLYAKRKLSSTLLLSWRQVPFHYNIFQCVLDILIFKRNNKGTQVTIRKNNIYTGKFFYTFKFQTLKPWLTTATTETKSWSTNLMKLDIQYCLLSRVGHRLTSKYFQFTDLQYWKYETNEWNMMHHNLRT